ncbi:lytic transglycosylase [Aureimonas sp. SA4125]|uniref:lytic transglycosylase domain-containing protein n=1 Tax=Aureimonas sp. SA4125 TaxID=2826993 RepID=UPI001CC3D41E|nr:lytic transglycosylase domain-containing protein [Aureimonas sp. SA4125]BDA83816.1 lytic transglycosylase [Aureimonas sp. SA4125]
MTAPRIAKSLIVKGMLLALLCEPANAQSLLPPVGPMPSLRPMARDTGVALDPSRFGTAPARSGVAAAAPAANPLTTRRPASVDTSPSAFTASITAITARPSNLSAIAGGLNDGLKAVSSGDLRRARSIRQGMPGRSLDRHILTWAIALNGGRDVPAHEIAQAASELQGWPGMSKLRANLERALLREEPSASDVVNAFAGSRPETPEGAMSLARALLELGQAAEAKRLITGVWHRERLDASLEQRILKQFGTLLTRADHKRRMDMQLYAERIGDAARMKKLAGAESLFAARAAAVRGEGGAAKLLSAVPAGQRSDPGYLFALAEVQRKAGKVDQAASTLLKAPRDAATLIDPDAWWNERRIVARDLLDVGRYKDAYRVASVAQAESPANAVEAEFHAGWIALRFLKDTRTAGQHFAKIAEASNRPLSQSRAYYWLGRTAEVSGSGNATNYFRRAAAYPTTYYGLLASARLGTRPPAVDYPRPSAAERQRFEGREAVRAIRRLEQLDMDSRAATLYRALADELTSPGELALLAVMAESKKNHYLALKVGKQANFRGVDAAALAFPIGVIPASANISASGKALAYAIARQESEFNPQAKSGAGALGLLQLMPGTAKSMAAKVGVGYSLARLTSDPGYNATLGARFLGEQIDNFDGSYILTFAAYNAGPRRAREWISRFGDPRGKSIDDVVDWVERIPFTETRNYVQRVMENYQIYKIRLGAPGSIEQDLVNGRRG